MYSHRSNTNIKESALWIWKEIQAMVPCLQLYPTLTMDDVLSKLSNQKYSPKYSSIIKSMVEYSQKYSQI